MAECNSLPRYWWNGWYDFLTGIFATKSVNSAGNDGLWLGNVDFFLTQLKALVIVVGYSFIVSYGILNL